MYRSPAKILTARSVVLSSSLSVLSTETHPYRGWLWGVPEPANPDQKLGKPENPGENLGKPENLHR